MKTLNKTRRNDSKKKQKGGNERSLRKHQSTKKKKLNAANERTNQHTKPTDKLKLNSTQRKHKQIRMNRPQPCEVTTSDWETVKPHGERPCTKNCTYARRWEKTAVSVASWGP